MYAVETAAALVDEAETTPDPTDRVRLLARAVLVLAHVDQAPLAADAVTRLAEHTADPDPQRRFIALVCTGIGALRDRDPAGVASLVEAGGLYADAGLDQDPLCLELMVQDLLHRLRLEEVAPLVGPHPERRLPDRGARCRVLTMVGTAQAWSGDCVRGYVTLMSARELAIAEDLVEQRAESSAVLAKVAAVRGRPDAAREHLDEARRYTAECGSEWIARGIGECAVSVHLATGDRRAWVAMLELVVAEGDGAASGFAHEYALELATVRRDDGDVVGSRAILDGLTDPPPMIPGWAVLVAWRRWLAAPGDTAARAAFVDAATAPHRPAAWGERGRALWLLGEEAVREGRDAAAIAHLERAARVYASVGAAGYLHRVLDLLHGLSPSSSPAPASVAAATGESRLTATETAVAVAVGDGLTNKEIAGRLHVSVKTVEFHLGNAYRKLGVRNRTELAVRLAPRQ